MNLTELKAKFPKASFHYEPTPTCKRCSGTGIRPPRVLSSGTELGESPCACVFLGPNTDWLVPLIAKSAKKALAELRNER